MQGFIFAENRFDSAIFTGVLKGLLYEIFREACGARAIGMWRSNDISTIDGSIAMQDFLKNLDIGHKGRLW